MTLRLIRPEPASETPPRHGRRWRDTLADACRGVKLGIRSQSSFFVHFFVATLVLLTAAIVQCDWPEWCLLTACIGLVFTAEMFNAAIIAIVRASESYSRDRPAMPIQIASGAVLTAICTSALVAAMVLGRRVWVFLS